VEKTSLVVSDRVEMLHIAIIPRTPLFRFEETYFPAFALGLLWLSSQSRGLPHVGKNRGPSDLCSSPGISRSAIKDS
jgi:hypothetical protein